jgi:hypothetical protein
VEHLDPLADLVDAGQVEAVPAVTASRGPRGRRRAKGTPSASNSSRGHPTPIRLVAAGAAADAQRVEPEAHADHLGAGWALKAERVPTLFWMNASGRRAAIAWIAFQPVQ